MGKSFVGVGDVLRVEGAADALHGFEVGFGEHVAHGALLLAADAVLAGDGAAGFDADVAGCAWRVRWRVLPAPAILRP